MKMGLSSRGRDTPEADVYLVRRARTEVWPEDSEAPLTVAPPVGKHAKKILCIRVLRVLSAS